MQPAYAWFCLGCGLVFIWCGAYARATLHSGAVFDPSVREIVFRRAPWTLWPWEPVEDFRLSFADVSAVELRSKRVRIDEFDHDNVELALVVRGGRRIALVAHTGAKRLQHDAQRLASLLQVPLTDRRPRR